MYSSWAYLWIRRNINYIYYYYYYYYDYDDYYYYLFIYLFLYEFIYSFVYLIYSFCLHVFNPLCTKVMYNLYY